MLYRHTLLSSLPPYISYRSNGRNDSVPFLVLGSRGRTAHQLSLSVRRTWEMGSLYVLSRHSRDTRRSSAVVPDMAARLSSFVLPVSLDRDSLA